MRALASLGFGIRLIYSTAFRKNSPPPRTRSQGSEDGQKAEASKCNDDDDDARLINFDFDSENARAKHLLDDDSYACVRLRTLD